MKLVITGIVVAACVAVVAAKAQDTSAQNGQAAAPEAASEANPPAISDIMAQQQERHIKLWFAGRGGNWPLAGYEVDALKGGFDDVNSQLGGSTVKDAVGDPISALEKAIDAKDRAAFARAYDKLTAGCNSCHQTLDHAFIVIRRPSLPPYSDQSFAAPNKSKQ